jgi:RNA polymerase sigma factor (sigma-70 family)
METRELAPEAVWAYQADVGRLARHLCRHPQDAEDVAQSALLKAVQHLDGFRAEASLRTWLHRVATNECRMLRRRKTPISLDTLLEEPDLGAGPKVGADRFNPEQAAVGGRAAGSRPSIAGGPACALSHGGAAEGRAGAVRRGHRRGNRHDRERGPLQAAPGPFAAA